MKPDAIAIIPARGGSKRIPRKNIKPFCGIPMIQRTIMLLLSSNIFKTVYVTTDEPEISSISTKSGAVVPFKRDSKLADDFTPTVPVIADCLRRIGKLENILYVCCVYPCTPMLNKLDLMAGLGNLKQTGKDFAYPVVKYSHPIQRRLSMSGLGSVKFAEPNYELTRTQDLEDFFHDSGQFYWGKKSAWLLEKRMHTDGIAFEINKLNSVDIDNEVDWTLAEAIFEFQRKGKFDG